MNELILPLTGIAITLAFGIIIGVIISFLLMKKICIVITSRSSLSKYIDIIKLLANHKKIKIYIILLKINF